MEQSFERIGPGLYQRRYEKADGGSSVYYYGRLKARNVSVGERPLFALGESLSEAKDRWQEIKIANRRARI